MLSEKTTNLFARLGKKERLMFLVIAGVFLLIVIASVQRVIAGSLDPLKGEAYRVIDVLDQYQKAALAYYVDWNEWPSSEGDWKQSLDHYMKNPHLGDGLIDQVLIVKTPESRAGYIGFRASEGASLENPAVQTTLKLIAADLPLYMDVDTPYTSGTKIYTEVTGRSLLEVKISAVRTDNASTSSASDTSSEDASRVLKILNQYKSTALMYYTDWAAWPTPEGNWKQSLDHYAENPHLGDGVTDNIRILKNDTNEELYIGFSAQDGSLLADPKVQQNLKQLSGQNTLYVDAGKTPYQMGLEIYVPIKGEALLMDTTTPEVPTSIKTEVASSRKDSVEIIKTLRSYKSAALMYYTDWSEWPSPDGEWIKSLDEYLDTGFDTSEYSQLVIVDDVKTKRRLIGLHGTEGSLLSQPIVQEQLQKQAAPSALLDAEGNLYKGGSSVYMWMK